MAGARAFKTAVCGCLVWLVGCSATKSAGWHPESEQDMKMLIGQTVMEAIHQYQMQLWKSGVQVPKAGSRMNKEPQPGRNNNRV